MYCLQRADESSLCRLVNLPVYRGFWRSSLQPDLIEERNKTHMVFVWIFDEGFEAVGLVFECDCQFISEFEASDLPYLVNEGIL